MVGWSDLGNDLGHEFELWVVVVVGWGGGGGLSKNLVKPWA